MQIDINVQWITRNTRTVYNVLIWLDGKIIDSSDSIIPLHVVN